MKKFVFLMLLPFLVACSETGDDLLMNTELSGADMTADCPDDVSDADWATSPACSDL